MIDTQPEDPDEAMEDDLSFLDSIDDDTLDETDGNASNLAMFEGDTSALYPEQRRCLHALLKQRYISAERHPEHWSVLVANVGVIRSRLNELFLILEIEPDQRIAFKRHASSETGDPLPSLLRDVSHTKEETIVMMALRQRFYTQRQEGEDVVFVDGQMLLDEVADQRPDHATHRAMDQKRATKAIDGLATAGVLLRTNDPDRFRISPIIQILMPIEKLRVLWTWLITQNGTENDDDNDADAQDADETLDLLVGEEDA